MPRRSATPGRNPSISASAVSTNLSTTSTPSGDLRSTPMDRRPRASRSPGGRSGSPPDTFCARSMRMTSAPMSARSIPQYGAGPSPASSTTVMPASGPAMCVPPVVPALAAPAASARVVGHVRGDGVDDAGPELRRQVVAHPLDDEHLGVGDDLGRPLAARRLDQRVLGPVDDERRHVEAPQAVGPAAGGEDRRQLAG